ncbi:hypothetical protein AG1IA_07661 [Rhizoctonia solani AG-1 IA]|uniref:Uncharacterized protein n=1 Tax=Thanatephorus cucumeris (strain AG1-IA) TaxID=983506 RepID=L8WNF9_THACA|nr:hypothetical protein AG1IA_07661 [Rhizoctonia solani AG-1 IA]
MLVVVPPLLHSRNSRIMHFAPGYVEGAVVAVCLRLEEPIEAWPERQSGFVEQLQQPRPSTRYNHTVGSVEEGLAAVDQLEEAAVGDTDWA